MGERAFLLAKQRQRKCIALSLLRRTLGDAGLGSNVKAEAAFTNSNTSLEHVLLYHRDLARRRHLPQAYLAFVISGQQMESFTKHNAHNTQRGGIQGSASSSESRTTYTVQRTLYNVQRTPLVAHRHRHRHTRNVQHTISTCTNHSTNSTSPTPRQPLSSHLSSTIGRM